MNPPALHGRMAKPPVPAIRGPLQGQAALITGAAQRIGAEVATRLAASGCDIVIHHRKSGKEATRLAASLQKAHGIQTATVAGDLGDANDRARLVPEASKALGKRLTLLVNNASSFPEKRLMDLTLDHLHEALAVNAWAPFELARDLAKQLPRGAQGSVVNFLDARIVDDDRRHVGYFLAKRMLADLTRLMALELAPRINVNAVAPGPTLPPPGWDPDEGAKLMARLRRRLPLQRTAEPTDLADAVQFLLSARVVTGQILFVDGGRHLGRQPG